MKKFIRKLCAKCLWYINRPLNETTISDKVFCIGLHKTGTTTLEAFFRQYGFKCTHSTAWATNDSTLDSFDFFSDGGSHFDGLNEFDFEKLYYQFKDAKFILQTRDTNKWLESKMIHAGWRHDTRLEKDDLTKITHDEWRYKSRLTVQKFIEHKFNYEEKVLSFFNKNNPDRLLCLDITDRKTQAAEVEKLKRFCGLRSVTTVRLPHSNKRAKSAVISKEMKESIRTVVRKNERQASRSAKPSKV